MRYEVEVEFQKNILKINGTRIRVGLKSKPKRGQANRELIRTLAKHFNVSTSHVRIISGLKSRRKMIEITMNEKE